ncbi:hypothetical protein ACHAWT_010926 [Skeletonema menzelii]
MSDANNNNDGAISGGDSAHSSVYYSAASGDNDSDQDQNQNERAAEEVVLEQVNFEGRRDDNQRREYRRRLTLDPLTDLIVNGDMMLLEEDGSDADNSGDEQQPDDVNMQQNQANQQPIARDPERDAVRQQLLVLLGEVMGGDDESSSDDDGYNQLNQNGDSENAAVDVSHLLARDHSYLPTAQPLYPEEWIPAGRHRNRLHQLSGSSEDMSQTSIENMDLNLNEGIKNEAGWSSQYEITEPPDGQSSAPRYRSLHAHEGIEVQPTNNVLAIMEVGDVVLFPGSVIPLRVRDPIWINYLGALIDDARGLYGSHSGSAGGMGEVQIGILPRISNRTRRRARRSSSASSEQTGGGRMGRWRIDLIRRGVAATRRVNRRRRSGNRDRMNMNSADGDENESESSHNARSMARVRDSVGDERREDPEDESSEEDQYFHPSISSPSSSNPYVGRVGTFATITFTHEEAAPSLADGVEDTAGTDNEQRSRSRVWQRHRGEIVVTALGTKRFRIVSPIDVNTNPKYQDRRYDGILFEVEEMNHSGVGLPPTWMLRSPGDFRYPIVTQSNSHVNAIWHLTHRSSSPALAYQSVWPWRIAQKICDLIQQTEQYQEIKKALNTAGGLVQLHDAFPGATQFRVVDPSAFSDWLSSNLPLSQNERLDLLEMECRASQLNYLLKNVEKDRETIIRCKCCASALSPMRNVFTVKGAEGTTGHYVNEHGVVHQTVTLREVDPKVSVVCVGRPETKDSWFPGYSWQIAYCYVCSSHLGWRFRQVSKSDEEEDPEQPAKFWGFSCSSITTENAVAPRRVVFNGESIAGMQAFAALGRA